MGTIRAKHGALLTSDNFTQDRRSSKKIEKMRTSLITIITLAWQFCAALELKFDLEDSRKDCFYEEVLQPGETIDVNFHVLEGGRRDVTLEVLDPNKKLIAQRPREKQASLGFKAMMKGAYSFCFSNEFSSFTHKLIYVEISTDRERKEIQMKEKEEKKMQNEAEKARAVSMTSLETSLTYIRKNMKRGSKGMKRFRKWDWLSEFHARRLSFSVDAASAGVAVAVVATSLIQTWVLRGLFADKKSSKTSTSTRRMTMRL